MRLQLPWLKRSSIVESTIIKTNGDFTLKIPNPSYFQNQENPREVSRLFKSLNKMNFDQGHDIILFKSEGDKLGVAGRAFTSWYNEENSSLSMKILPLDRVEKLVILNMNPAKGSGYGTISINSINKALIIFFSLGNGSWNSEFKKSESFLDDICKFTACRNLEYVHDFNT